MTSQSPDLDTMDFSTEITTVNTIDVPLFAEATKSLPESKITTPNEHIPTTTEKDKKEGKSEEIFVNLHPSDNTKHESAIIRKIKHGAEIVFKSNIYTTL